MYFSFPHHGDFVESSSQGCKWLRGQWATSSKEHDTRILLFLSQNYCTNQLPGRLRWVTLHARGRGEREGERERERERVMWEEEGERDREQKSTMYSNSETIAIGTLQHACALHCTRLTMVLTNSSTNLWSGRIEQLALMSSMAAKAAGMMVSDS